MKLDYEQVNASFFTLPLTLIRQNSWSFWSYCFIYPHSPLFIQKRSWHICMDWMLGIFFFPSSRSLSFFFIFCKVASENCEYFSRQTRWVREALSLSKMGINTENYMRVMGGRSAPFGPPFVCALLRSQPGSNWNVILFCYISEFLRKLIILGLCFPPFPVLFASLYEHTKVLKVKVREAQLARLQWEDLLTQHIYEDV